MSLMSQQLETQIQMLLQTTKNIFYVPFTNSTVSVEKGFVKID